MDTYVSCIQNTATQFIATRPIMELCLAAERRLGSKLATRWQDKDGLDLEGMQPKDREAEQTKSEEEKGATETETD